MRNGHGWSAEAEPSNMDTSETSETSNVVPPNSPPSHPRQSSSRDKRLFRMSSRDRLVHVRHSEFGVDRGYRDRTSAAASKRAKRAHKTASLAPRSVSLRDQKDKTKEERNSTLKRQTSLREELFALNAGAAGSTESTMAKLTRGSHFFETGFTMQSYNLGYRRAWPKNPGDVRRYAWRSIYPKSLQLKS